MAPNSEVENIEASQEAPTSESKTRTGGVRIRIIGAIAIAIAILLAFFAFTMAGVTADVASSEQQNEILYADCSNAINNLQSASDFLTTEARLFVVTGRKECMDDYANEITVVNRRENAVNTLRTSLSSDLEATKALQNALAASDELAQKEVAAMRLAADYYGVTELPDLVAKADVSSYGANLTPQQKLDKAVELVLNEEYDNAKTAIRENVKNSSDALLESLNAALEEGNTLTQNLLFQLRIAIALLLCVVMVLVLVMLMYVLKPLSRYIKRIEKGEPLEADGSYELHYLADAYNAMYEDNNKRIEQLRAFAERDPLTGISNRNGYESFLAKHTRDVALLLIDIDNFKDFNDVYGHDTGDAVMVKLANALSTAFRSTDFPCRIESDKFAVIMTNMNSDLRDAVSSKIDLVNSMLADDSDNLPLITLSVGAAFSTEGMNDKDIYRAAETALRQVQQSGRNGLAFYGERNG